MRKVLLTMALVAAFAVPTVNEAHAVVEETMPEVIDTVGVSNSNLLPFLGAVGVAAGAAYLILAQKDQYDEPIYHRIACGLFGDEGRVSEETDSACKHIE